MTTELSTIKSTGRNKVDLSITQFMGNKELMVQITQGFGCTNLNHDGDEPGFIHLTVSDAYKVIQELSKWIKQRAGEDAADLRGRIKECKELEKTIIKDAVDCERFINELEILEIPLRLLGYQK